MATPLAAYANARLLIELPGSRGGPETGYRRTTGEQVVVLAFLKQASAEARAQFQQLTNASIAADLLQGYAVAHAPLPEGAEWSALDVAAAPGADTSGSRPAQVRKGARLAGVQFGARVSEVAELVEFASAYDDLGIGAIVRQVIGDRLVVGVEWRQ